MKWWNTENKEEKMQQQFLSEFKTLLSNVTSADDTIRSRLSNLISGGYDFGDILHQIYEDFGYPQTLHFGNFWNMYRRFGPAQAVCDIPVDITWLEEPEVDGGDKFNSEFEKLVKKTKLWKRLKGLDNRQRVGRYAGLYIRVKDSKKPSDELESLNGVDTIESLTPLYEGQLEVSTVDQDPLSVRFGDPVMYDFKSSTAGNRNEESLQSFQIHHSRVVIFAEGADDGTIYGKSALESVYNDLMDLRKISGAGGEGFYQNSRNAPVINTKEGYSPPATTKEKDALETQMDEFLNKWRKKFVAQGLEFNYPDVKLDDPKSFYENSMNNVSAGSKIPNKFIMGNQTGRLAGDSDNVHFLSLMNSRRENFATEGIEDFITWCTDFNVLPEPIDLTIEWSDLLAQSEKDRALLAKDNAAAFSSAASALSQPAVDGVVNVEDVMTMIFGEEALEDFTFSDRRDDGLTDEEIADAELDNIPPQLGEAGATQ